MRHRFTYAFLAIVLPAAATLTITAQQAARQGGGAARAQAGAPAARTARGGVERGRGTAPAARLDRIAGRSNLNGIWQAINTANWNLEDHAAAATAFWQLGAMFAIP